MDGARGAAMDPAGALLPAPGNAQALTSDHHVDQATGHDHHFFRQCAGSLFDEGLAGQRGRFDGVLVRERRAEQPSPVGAEHRVVLAMAHEVRVALERLDDPGMRAASTREVARFVNEIVGADVLASRRMVVIDDGHVLVGVGLGQFGSPLCR